MPHKEIRHKETPHHGLRRTPAIIRFACSVKGGKNSKDAQGKRKKGKSKHGKGPWVRSVVCKRRKTQSWKTKNLQDTFSSPETPLSFSIPTVIPTYPSGQRHELSARLHMGADITLKPKASRWIRNTAFPRRLVKKRSLTRVLFLQVSKRGTWKLTSDYAVLQHSLYIQSYTNHTKKCIYTSPVLLYQVQIYIHVQKTTVDMETSADERESNASLFHLWGTLLRDPL